MDFLFELLFELLAEGTVELSRSIKVPKYIRYPAIGLVVLFFAAVIGVLLLVGVAALKDNFLFGFLLLLLGVWMLLVGIIKFKKTYLKRKNRT